MKQLRCLLLALALAGCSSTVPQAELQPAHPPDQIVDETPETLGPQRVGPNRPSRPRTATMLKNETNEGKAGELMDCDESCKNNCSPKKQSRPKWCVLYKNPRD